MHLMRWRIGLGEDRGLAGSQVESVTAVASSSSYVLGIKNDAARMKVTPPLAVAPLAQEDDMRWNPNDDGINMYP